MVVEESKYKYLKFKGRKEFEAWLKEKSKFKIYFADEGQDFLEWYLDERGEVLHSDLQAFVWNGKMVEIDKMRIEKYLPLQGGDSIIHLVRRIEVVENGEVKEFMDMEKIEGQCVECGKEVDHENKMLHPDYCSQECWDKKLSDTFDKPKEKPEEKKDGR